jgi:hypothetical protein
LLYANPLLAPQLGDYINSKEYRKPEWLIKMEEIKERLAGENVQYRLQ